MISEFMGGRARYLHVGDVKYHLGTRGELQFGNRRVRQTEVASRVATVCVVWPASLFMVEWTLL